MRNALHIPNDGISNYSAIGAAADDRSIEMRQQISANRAIARMKASAKKGRRKAAGEDSMQAPKQNWLWRPGRDFRLMPRR